MATLLHLLLIALSLIGITEASYLSYEKLAHITPPCVNLPGFDCGSVLNSPWAMLGPLPIPVWGLMFYSTFFVISITIFLWPAAPKWLKIIWRLLSLFGLLFSGYLMFIMLVLIGNLCIYCLGSALTCLSLFIIHNWHGWLKLRAGRTRSAAKPHRPRAFDDLDDDL